MRRPPLIHPPTPSSPKTSTRCLLSIDDKRHAPCEGQRGMSCAHDTTHRRLQIRRQQRHVRQPVPATIFKVKQGVDRGNKTSPHTPVLTSPPAVTISGPQCRPLNTPTAELMTKGENLGKMGIKDKQNGVSVPPHGVQQHDQLPNSESYMNSFSYHGEHSPTIGNYMFYPSQGRKNMTETSDSFIHPTWLIWHNCHRIT